MSAGDSVLPAQTFDQMPPWTEESWVAFDLSPADLLIFRMKIIRIIARLNVGGPARHVIWLTKNLQTEEFESLLVTGTVPKGEENMSWFAAKNDVEPVIIPEMSRELSIRDVTSLWKVYRFILKEKPDIIHTHTAKAGTIGRVAGFAYRWLTFKTLIGKPRRVKIVHTYHGHVFHNYYGKTKTRVFLMIERLLARFATHKIVVLTKQQYTEIHKKYNVGQADQFRIVPLGIDLETFETAAQKQNILRREIGVDDAEILIGFVGRLTEIKNIPLLLKVAKLYLDAKTAELPNLTFLIIGDGHLRRSLEEQAQDLGLGKTLRFLGNRRDTDVFYAGLDIVALASLNEGTPLSLIEAMANGKAVISSVVGGVTDLLGRVELEKEHFNVCERGIGVEPNTSEGFYEGLIYLAKDAQLRAEKGIAGCRFINEHYSKDYLIWNIKKLYHDLNIS